MPPSIVSVSRTCTRVRICDVWVGKPIAGFRFHLHGVGCRRIRRTLGIGREQCSHCTVARRSSVLPHRSDRTDRQRGPAADDPGSERVAAAAPAGRTQVVRYARSMSRPRIVGLLPTGCADWRPPPDSVIDRVDGGYRCAYAWTPCRNCISTRKRPCIGTSTNIEHRCMPSHA